MSHSDQGLVAVKGCQMHADNRHLDARRTEEPSQDGDIGQFTGIEALGELLGRESPAEGPAPTPTAPTKTNSPRSVP